MTLPLLLLAYGVALNPLRAAAVAPVDDADRRTAVALAGLAVVGLALGSAAASGPVLDWLSVSGSSARIAAGVALAITSLRDVLLPATQPEPALPGALAGLVPLAFPTLFTPAVAFLSLAAGAERGVAITAVALVPAVAVAVGVALVAAGRTLRRGVGVVGLAGVGIGALVTLDGVYAV